MSKGLTIETFHIEVTALMKKCRSLAIFHEYNSKEFRFTLDSNLFANKNCGSGFASMKFHKRRWGVDYTKFDFYLIVCIHVHKANQQTVLHNHCQEYVLYTNVQVVQRFRG